MADVTVTGFEKVEAEIQKRINSSMWETTKAMAEELTILLRETLHNLYARQPVSKFYDRTGEFAESVYVKPTQGHGSYGLSIRWKTGVIQVHMAPLTKNGKRGKKFNAHADYWGNPISIEMLASLQDERKFEGEDRTISELLAQTAKDFIDSKGWGAVMSIQNYDEFGFEMFL
jgi:hypothetical protein